MSDDRCPISELPPAMCGHCRHPGRPTQRPATRYGPWFLASYAGECHGCGDRIEPGGRIRADGTGGYLCEDCGQDDQEEDVNSQTALTDLIAGLGQPTTPWPAGTPCLDPWCANGAIPCGHSPDAHMEHHGAAAVIAGQPTSTQASTRIANRESRPATPANDWPLPAVEIEQAERAGLVVRPESPAITEPNSPPPSTVAEMREVLTALDAGRPRSQQTTLGPSELGTPCQRQIAYKLAGAPRQLPDKRPPWAPMQGTAMHVLMAEALEFHNQQLGRPRWIVEERLQMDAEISGSGDAYDTDNACVVDWKYVGTTALRGLRHRNVPNDRLVKPDYRVQAHLYGYGHERAGRDVRWVRLVFLARSHNYDDSAEWTEQYRPEIAIRALDRYYATQDLLQALDATNNPTLWAVVPADPGKACDWCPFLRSGGPADGTGCPGNTNQKITKQTAGILA